MSAIETMLQELEHEAVATRQMLERVPTEALNWKPHEKSMTLGRLATHVAEIPEWAVSTLEKDGLDFDPKDFKPVELKDTAAIVKMFDASLEKARKALKGGKDEALGKIWTMKMAGKTIIAMPKGVVLRAWVLSHLIHHRAQLGVYLRMKNVPLPKVYGPTADDQGF